MPSDLAIATIPEMITAASAAAWARKSTADTHSGGGYDCHAGVGALLWIREMSRDRDSFRLCYDDTAPGDALEWRITQKGGPARIVATRGAGLAELQLPGTETPAAGTIWEGTRIAVTGIGATPRFYRIASDTPVDAASTGMSVAIEAEDYGSGTAIDTAAIGARCTWEDAVFNGWTIASVQCAAGLDREPDALYHARWRQQKLDRRAGYPKAISDAFVAAGARYVVLLASDFIAGGTDCGINRAFVADANYQSPTSLLRACRMAADSVRVLGCDLTVWGITRVAQSFDLTVTTWDGLTNVDPAAIRTAVQDGALHYFSRRDNGFVFKRDGLRASVLQQTDAVQSLDFGAGDPVDTTIGSAMESTALPLLFTDRSLINVTLAGPV